uniref:Uncharacterized protein n=1 Tax=Aegilops tauschii subsp. strangulata TaxID=200361 RepID=A0A453SKK8_AEGTS
MFTCKSIMSCSLAQVLQQLNLSPNEHISFADEKGESDKAKRPWDLIPSNHRIGEIVPLFTELVCTSTLFMFFLCIHFHPLYVRCLHFLDAKFVSTY